jgi:hypothetical protein
VALDLPPVDRALSSDEGALTEYCCRSRRLAEDFHHLLLRFRSQRGRAMPKVHVELCANAGRVLIFLL